MLRKDGQNATIYDVLYEPSIKSNLISISQLVIKGYNMKMANKQMKVCDAEGRFILNESLEDKKTFKIETNMIDH